jgi:hypothetical protein
MLRLPGSYAPPLARNSGCVRALQITVADRGAVARTVAGVGRIFRRRLADQLGGRRDIVSDPP